MTLGLRNSKKITALLTGVAAMALVFTAVPDTAFAQSGHSSTDSHSSHSGKSGSGGKKLRKGKSDATRGQGRGGSKSLRDVFHEMDDGDDHGTGAADDHDDHSSGKKSTSAGKKGVKQAGKKAPKSVDKATAKGKKPASGHDDTETASEDEDSDRPEWAGTPGKEGKPGNPNQTAGTKKGDLFGDMYVLLRDENGVPIYTQLPDGTWVVQPVDINGVPIPLDEEGHPIDEEATVEVELGRLNVGRAPLNVLVRRYDEVLKVINDATAVSLDPSGRLVFTIDGEEKTIDSPLENLAIFVELMNTGTLTDVANPSIFTGDLANLVDGSYTVDDLVEAKSFLAAASDKTGSIDIDKVEYLSAFLGIEGPLIDQVGSAYVDYTTFSYDRTATYQDVTAEVIVQQPDGSWVPQTVNVYETVFNSQSYDGNNVDAFAQAADDARAVIEFIHEYEVPETPAASQ